jgi:hypothetical protein
MAERRFRRADPVRRIAQLLEIYQRQRRGSGSEALDQRGDGLVADVPGKVRFEVIASAADKGFVEQRLDLAIGRRGDLIHHWRPKRAEGPQYLFPCLDTAAVADDDGR